jgi:hypothetical protein
VHLVVVAPARRQRAASGIPRQLPRFAAVAAHDVDLLVAVDLAGERDPAAVRRELREQLDARCRGQSRRRPTLDRRQPEVAAIGEHDALAVNVRMPQQARLRGRKAA